jgi:hypothetical protein
LRHDGSEFTLPVRRNKKRRTVGGEEGQTGTSSRSEDVDADLPPLIAPVLPLLPRLPLEDS